LGPIEQQQCLHSPADSFAQIHGLVALGVWKTHGTAWQEIAPLKGWWSATALKVKMDRKGLTKSCCKADSGSDWIDGILSDLANQCPLLSWRKLPGFWHFVAAVFIDFVLVLQVCKRCEVLMVPQTAFSALLPLFIATATRAWKGRATLKMVVGLHETSLWTCQQLLKQESAV
jgi:hypothetical protein